MMYDYSNPLLTHHSNQLLTHSLKIPAKIERPHRSLRSLWGLINPLFIMEGLVGAQLMQDLQTADEQITVTVKPYPIQVEPDRRL